ncbi:hypothetical protein BLIN9172_02296 [Brevibacterium linens ATCC 9172]|uniref:UvrABC system protein A n=2 Tax=Brevibacterium linens TaxID=1703 RepID=A0A2H1HQE0_BRELN|nr:hypothetical protein BLIN101_00388 [Brevibacterium linens]SMX88541.1 hypothetical protein BLIN9172_02296 [Brevibacterium linens ATCC 9172]
MHTADSHDLIRVSGARENNLKNLSVEIPKRRLTVFTGVSGSGKSSLVFHTIAAESQRMINETYSAFVQGFMPAMARPEVDVLEGLTTAILVDQERIGANPRSTVGTVSDINAKLRTLFARLAEPNLGSTNAYSFNVATLSGKGAVSIDKGEGEQVERRSFSVNGGMCPQCEGMGTATDISIAEVVDESKSLNDGAITVPGYKPGGWSVRMFSESGYFDPDKPIADFDEKERHYLLYAEGEKVRINGTNITFDGLIPRIQRSFLSKDRDSMQKHIREFVNRAVVFTTCPDCEGTRLNAAARSSLIAGRSIADVCALQISDITKWLDQITPGAASALLKSLRADVRAFNDIGLGYLSLDRSAGSLSGGEAQRIKLVRHLGSSLTDVTYVFDEPTIGLHPHDIRAMNDLLLALRDKGNTVLVVEHKPETILIADHIVDLGPGAGSTGGEVTFTGTVDGLRESDTLTGRHLGYRTQGHGAGVGGGTGDPGCRIAQSARRRCRCAPRRAHRRHRSRRFGQEQPHRRVPAGARWSRDDRSGADQGIPAQQPGHVYGDARAHPEGVREGQWGQTRPVQREFRRRVPGVQRRRDHLFGYGAHGRCVGTVRRV